MHSNSSRWFGQQASEPSLASMSTPEKASLSMSCSVEPQVLLAEASSALNLNVSMALENENEINSKNHSSDIAFPSDGHNVNLGIVAYLDDESKAVDSSVAECSETFQNHSTMLHHGDVQLPIEVAAQETNDSGEKELSNKPYTTKSELKKEMCEQVRNDQNGALAMKIVSEEAANNSAFSAGPDKQYTVQCCRLLGIYAHSRFSIQTS
ncbi:uncharacterized protein LOC111294260 [Durio zibethinus]|uniref:Uncharacterized protein LOC111294260 n=1 Tax=Durio zibethinus TaxID=66656 RepID=A0A6P5YSR3_DURZI|nr:uncharacterized protein LOC111294260 [Durio zibethinus]